MIVDKKDPFESAELLEAGQPGVSAGTSGPSSSQHGSASPSADAEVPEYTEHAMDNWYIPAGGEEPPPEFAPYEAEFFISGKEIVSHDPHLNEDGEALYRFLLSQSMARPEYRIHARGTHTEHKSRTVFSTDQNGKQKARTEHYSETVVDFDFYLDLTPQIVHGPVHWSIPDAEPAYRGEMDMQVDLDEPMNEDPETRMPTGRRKAMKHEIKTAKEHNRVREQVGLPPWIVPSPDLIAHPAGGHPPDPAIVLRSSKTLRQWADEYCASQKLLKEFTYTKVVHGWHISNLKEAITASIRSVYSHNIQVDVDISHHKIRIRPDNGLSRMLSNKWLKFLLFILLIYPFIWLFKRFSRQGGGRWEVCGGAYALKSWQLQPPGVVPPPYNGDGCWQQTPDGLMCLVGEREGEWFQRWANTIRGAVRDRIQSKMPLEYMNAPALRLDGYQPGYGLPQIAY